MTSRHAFGVVGWVLSFLAVPVVVDVLAVRFGRATMSRVFGRFVWHDVAGPCIAAAACGLVWHLALVAIDERPRR